MNVQFFSSVNDLQQSEGMVGGAFDINTQSQLNNSHGGGVSSGDGDYGDEVVNVGGGSCGGEQYSPSNSFGSMVDIQSQQTYSIGDLNQLNQFQQQQHQASNLNTMSYNHPTSSAGNVTVTNYYGGGGDNLVVDYTSQYQQTSNSNANIGGGGSVNSKMRNSFTNSSAIYNVNNYIGR